MVHAQETRLIKKHMSQVRIQNTFPQYDPWTAKGVFVLLTAWKRKGLTIVNEKQLSIKRGWNLSNFTSFENLWTIWVLLLHRLLFYHENKYILENQPRAQEVRGDVGILCLIYCYIHHSRFDRFLYSNTHVSLM